MELDDIVKIIKLGTPSWVNEAVIEHKRLNVHINGKDTAKYLTLIGGIENKNQLKLRQDYLTTNRYALSNLSRPIDKVFSAKGGGNIYSIDQKAKEETLRGKLSNVRHGKAIRTWIKDIQANKYYTDPAGLVFFEVKDNETYPTIKSIKSIQNYKSDGRTVEWVLFNPYIVDDKKDVIYYRFVDKDNDTLIKKAGENYTIVEDETFTNPFGEVPAIINSNIINSDLTHAESPFEVIISLADHYLRTGTIKNLVEFLHGYPIFWRYLSDCIYCKGSGYINGKSCSHCNGTGKNLNKHVTDIINVEIPADEGVKLAPDLAGYISPDITAWQEMRTEQEYIQALMELTMWGSKMAKDANNETATAAFLNVQPVNDRLNDFADAFEDMEKKMTNFIGTFYLTTYNGSSISYGRRFLVEPPDVIWKKYETAREKNAPKVTLDYLLIQFYQSEFANDLQNLTIAQKSIKLEPFIHKSDEDLMKLPVLESDKKAKIYFPEWYKTITEIDLLSKDVNSLNKEFETYLGTIETTPLIGQETNTT